MLKSKAIELLGGTPTAAAAAIGVTPQAVTDWPKVLPARIADRVQAALWRMEHPDKARRLRSPATPRASAAARGEGRPTARARTDAKGRG